MTFSKTYNTKIGLVINSGLFFKILLLLVWTNSVLVSYIRQTILIIPGFESFAEPLIITIFALFSLLSLPYLFHKVKIIDTLFFLFIEIFYLLSIRNQVVSYKYLDQNAFTILSSVFPAYLVGVCIRTKDHLCILHISSLICIALTLLHFAVFGLSFEENATSNMGQAYRILQHLSLVYFFSFKNKKIIDIIVAIVGTLMLIACGNRGTILAVLILFFVLFFFYNHFRKKLIVIPFIAFFAFIVILNVEDVVTFLKSVFENLGFSTRLFDQFLTGDLTNDSGRGEILKLLFGYINLKPYSGYGLAADRAFTISGGYSHNIVVELFISFGYIIGSLLILLMAYVIIRAFYYSDRDERFVLLSLIFGGSLFKLLFSSSYLLEYQFFLFIGLCVGLFRSNTEKIKNYEKNRYFNIP